MARDVLAAVFLAVFLAVGFFAVFADFGLPCLCFLTVFLAGYVLAPAFLVAFLTCRRLALSSRYLWFYCLTEKNEIQTKIDAIAHSELSTKKLVAGKMSKVHVP